MVGHVLRMKDDRLIKSVHQLVSNWEKIKRTTGQKMDVLKRIYDEPVQHCVEKQQEDNE